VTPLGETKNRKSIFIVPGEGPPWEESESGLLKSCIFIGPGGHHGKSETIIIGKRVKVGLSKVVCCWVFKCGYNYFLKNFKNILK
jgi:hypothetical protein